MKESGHLDVISDLIFYLLIKGRIKNISLNKKHLPRRQLSSGLFFQNKK